MSKLQSFLEEFSRNTGTQEDKWYASSCFVLFLEEVQCFVFTEDHFVVAIVAFNIVHVNWNFNLQNVNIVTVFSKFFDHCVNLVRFYLGIFSTLSVINVGIV